MTTLYRERLGMCILCSTLAGHTHEGTVADPGGGGSEVSTEPPFLAGYVIKLLVKLICTVRDPGFMEPPFLPFS